MDTAIVIAVIALAGSLLSTAATVYGAPAFQDRSDRRRVLETYREPLLAAAYELQARLHNILRNGFVETYVVDDRTGRRQAALDSTLYVFAQYFAWREIIRRDVQFLQFDRDVETREVTRLLRDITETFLDNAPGSQMMIWRVDQRGLGERLIVSPPNRRPTCMGYAQFVAEAPSMRAGLDPLERDLVDLDASGRQRLTKLQHLLLDLVRRLDEERTRYPFDLERA